MENREIKFRAWDAMTWKMIYYIESDCLCFGLMTNQGLTPMQYTGLKDKNGKEIWGGDIVRLLDRFNRLVLFRHGSYGYYSDDDTFISFQENKNLGMSGNCIEKAEVIGNIYEHPHLLI